MNIQKLIENLFQIDSNTSATIIITIIVFGLGYAFSSCGKAINNYYLRKANRKLFIKNLETLIASLKKRREVIKIQLGHLNIKTFSAVPIGKIQFFQIAILNSMTHKDSFECFFSGFENIFYWNKEKRLRNKCFIKVWENMANIEFWENSIYESMKLAQEEINRMNEIMGNHLRDMRILFTELLTQLNDPTTKPDEKQFLTEVKSIVDLWASQQNIDHGQTVNEYLSKKFILLNSKYGAIPSARKLIQHSIDASYWYGNIVLINQSLQNTLENHDISMRYFMRSTKVIIKTLN
ncbi:hypothetical protein [Flavobacterium sp. KACC 22761]|uniref:hypothetical protein n=1 Tax=Flavobacterium sp. KACC 22761 TaxID=3092665 RepID=UPI002A754A96|nr:hypothetical protein [Flavobacterium sp. KACC 22761]WPO77326.1 hypothetical protein SCB73_13735 [Flavobacterium sp. KACC 22761]